MIKTEKYFKDKINWKFLNYLIDKATIFEDNGGAVTLAIRGFYTFRSLEINNLNDMLAIYVYDDNDGYFLDTNFCDRLINLYQDYGLFYTISVQYTNEKYHIETYYKSVVDKFGSCQLLSANEKILVAPDKIGPLFPITIIGVPKGT